ncbi:MAG TPA: KedN5 family methylcobalamin-dependent radical SAM C-methyltransferase [Pyrinomonadaceae bacterium]
MTKVRVSLVDQGVWKMSTVSMPLSLGYIKATAYADPGIRSATDIKICSFRGSTEAPEIARALLSEQPPDILAFSVFGWNLYRFASIAETYRQIKPDGWIVVGGTHVANQAERLCRLYPAIDVVVNGEGEFIFRDILKAYLGGVKKSELDHIHGISFQRDGRVITTPERPRIASLEDIPSPFLEGVLPFRDKYGKAIYGVALLETNRGCPYKCAFCYWGGAIGQKVRAFSRERLREELKLFARESVESIALCDANLGLLPDDEVFVDDVIRMKERYGYPLNIEASWAKNKGERFYRIVRKMKQAGLKSSFTLSLQSLEERALEKMHRENMKLNEFDDLGRWLQAEGLDTYAELIWGLPGETPDSFIEGYDRISEFTSRIATYPHLLLPNTDFYQNRERYGLVTVRHEEFDFEYVISHPDMTIEDNARMHQFLFWSRVVGENAIFRNIWGPLRKLASIKQSQVLKSLDEWCGRQTDDVVRGIWECREEMVQTMDSARVHGGIRYFYYKHAFTTRLESWWEEEILPLVPVDLRPFFTELFRYELLTLPVPEDSDLAAELKTVFLDEKEFFAREVDGFHFDISTILRSIEAGVPCDLAEGPPRSETFYYRVGFADYIDSHELVILYSGRSGTELLNEKTLAEFPTVGEGLPFEEAYEQVVGAVG